MLVTCARCNAHVDTGDASPGDVIRCGCGLGIMVPEAPAAAGKMSCPSCGAPVDPEVRICGFCDTRLATVMCPSCFGVVFDGAKHCKHCGAGLQRDRVIHHGDETKRECPRCDAHPRLRIEVVAGSPIERCPECEGLWVDRETVEQIYKNREQASTIQSMTAASKAAGTGEFKPEGYIPCPECGKLMNRQNFGRFSGVIIDICKSHGTWFDADELRRIVEFIQTGGLEKHAEREREELKQELRWLRTKARMEETRDAMRGGTGGIGGEFGGGRLLGGRSALAIGSLLRKLF